MKKKDCKYYPCHFEGQSCDYCYCPFYPCEDPSMGSWLVIDENNRIWDCSKCISYHK